jgi:hypothetical protein
MDRAVGEDLRKSKRLLLNLPVKVTRQPHSRPQESFFISSITQLSSDGAFLSTSAQYPTGTMIALDFDIPTAANQTQAVHALGKIAWQISEKSPEETLPSCQNPDLGVGIHFIMMTQKEKDLIQAFVTHQNEDSGKKGRRQPSSRNTHLSPRKTPTA